MQDQEDVIAFSTKIEHMVNYLDIPYMDAVLLYCEETGLEVELAAKLVQGSIKSKIKIEAEDLHFLPRSNTAKLPI